MDNQQTSSLEAASVRLALFMRRHCTVHSRSSSLFLSVYEALNLLSASLANVDYPWYDGVSSVIWKGLKCSGRTVTFLHDDGTPDYILLAALVTTLTMFWLALCFLMWSLAQMHDFEFKRVLNSQAKIRFQAAASYIVLTCTVVHEVIYIPYLDWLSNTRPLLPYCIVLQGALATTVIASWVYLTSYKLGSRAYSAMSAPYFALYGKGTYSLFILSTSLFPFSTHSLLHEACYILCGGFWLTQVFLKLPYQQDLLTKLEIAKSLFLLWTGLALSLAEVNYLSGAGLLFLHLAVYAAAFAVVMTLWEWYRGAIGRRGEPKFEFEVELRLRWHLASFFSDRVGKQKKVTKEIRKRLDSQEIDRICKDAFHRFRTHPYTLMCLIEYFLLLKEKIFVKVLLSQLQTLEKDPLSFIDIACCEYAVLNALAGMKSDQEAVQYYKFFQHIRRVKEEDEQLCVLLYRISQLYESSLFSTSDMSRLLAKVVEALRKTKRTYESLAQVIGDNPDFGALYAGFLRLFHSPEKAHSIESRIKHMKHEMISKYRAKEKSVYFFDEMNLVLLVSMDANAQGKIVIAKGANLLGFEDSELIDTNCKILIPEMFRIKHSSKFGQVYSYRHRHEVYKGVHQHIFVNKDGFCHFVHWKNRLINYDKGKLGAFVAIRLLDEKEDFALVNGSHLADMTENFHKAMADCDLRSALEKRINTSTYWLENEVLYRPSHSLCGSVVYRSKIIRVIDTLDLKVVVMDSKCDALPTKSLSAKSVGFDVVSASGTETANKDSRVSKDTSLGSSTAFFTSISRFHGKEKAAVKVLTLVTMGIVVAGVAAQGGVVAIIHAQTVDMNTDVELIKTVSVLGTYLQLAAIDIREYSLSPLPPFTRSSAEVLFYLTDISYNLMNLTQSLIDYSESSFPQSRKPLLPWWTLSGAQLALGYKNLVDLSAYLQACVNSIVASQAVDYAVVTELMRNAPAETIRSIDALVRDRIEYHETNFASTRDALIIPLFIGFYVCTAALLVVAFCTLVTVGRHRRRVVQEIATLSTATVVHFHNSVWNRLEQVHGYEFTPAKVRGGRKVVYSLHKLQVVYWATVMAGFAIAVICFQVNYERSFSSLQATLYQQPYIFFITSTMKTKFATALFWLREVYLQRKNELSNIFLPANNFSPSPSASTLSAVSSLLRDYEQLRGRSPSHSTDWELSSSHLQFLYTATNSTSAVLSLGFTPSVLQLLDSVSACIGTIQSADQYGYCCRETEQSLFALIALSDDNQNYYHDSADQRSQAAKQTALTTLAVYIVSAVVYVGLVYFPVTRWLVTALGQETDLYGLMTNAMKGDTTATGKLSTVVRVSLQ